MSRDLHSTVHFAPDCECMLGACVFAGLGGARSLQEQIPRLLNSDAAAALIGRFRVPYKPNPAACRPGCLKPCMRALTWPRGARCAQGKERNRDLLNIEVVAAINQAHCRLHHLRNCLPSEELARECGRARPRSPPGLRGCQPGSGHTFERKL